MGLCLSNLELNNLFAAASTEQDRTHYKYQILERIKRALENSEDNKHLITALDNILETL